MNNQIYASNGFDEMYAEFYRCPACGSWELQVHHKYCYNCAMELDWEATLLNEKLKRKKLKEHWSTTNNTQLEQLNIKPTIPTGEVDEEEYF